MNYCTGGGAAVMIVCLLATSHLNAFDAYDLHKAASAYRSGDFATAQSLYEKLYVHSQSHPETTYNYAKSSYALGELEKAEALFQDVLNSESISDILQKQTHFDMGNTLVRQKKYEDALPHYEAVCALEQSHKEAQEMIEHIKKLLEQQKQQNQNQQQQPDKNDTQQDSEKSDESRSDESRSDESRNDDSCEKDQQQQSSDKQSQDNRSDGGKGDDESQSQEQQSSDDSQKTDTDNSQQGDQQQQSASDKSNQSGNDHDAQRDLENQVAPDKGSQGGRENQYNQPDNQPLGQSPQNVDGSPDGDNKQNDSKDGKPQHQQPSHKNDSSRNPSQQDMTTGGEAQEFEFKEDDPLSEAEQQLVRVLQKEETEALKDLVNAHIKGMPQNGGQKNW